MKNGFALYVSANLAFLIVMGLGYAIGAPQDPRFLYLALLFALCSSSLLDLDGLNGRHSLLAIFLTLYFLFYGVQDLTDLFTGIEVDPEGGVLSVTEAMILIGGLILVLGYRFAVRFQNQQQPAWQARDWSLRSTVLVGLSLWSIGILATYYWYFFIVTDKTLEGTHGMSKISAYLTAGLVLAEMLQPLGFLLIAYAWRSTRSVVLLAAVLSMLAVQVLFGFVIDIKGMALSGGFLIIVTIIFGEGRIPKGWLVAAALFVYIAFPVFQAYRAVITGNNVARTEVLSNLGATLDRVLAAKERVNTGQERAQTFFERLSLKGSVEMIVKGTARGVPFQHGYTLEPILSAFLPRIFWTDKPDIPTGRLVNKAFNVTDQDETYISPSHLGELYWNFGWPGVLGGMGAIGLLLGWIGRFSMAECRTVTRLLLIVTTIELLMHGFEGAIASSYVVWLRCAVAIGLLHLLFARVPIGSVANRAAPETKKAADAPPIRAYPNLLT